MLKQPNLQVSKHKPVSSKDTNKTDSSIDAQQAETPTIKMDYREPIHMSKEILFNKYFESFNFYFSKHINEILADLALPHVILYKDYLYYDDEEEYLRRYYRADEAISRIPNLSKFYSNVEGNINKPNLAVHEQNEIILKRNSRLHELFVNKLKNFESIPKTHRDHEKPITFRVLPRPEEQTGFCEEDDSGTSYTQKKRQDVLVEDEKPNNSFQRALEAQEDMDEVSYESQEHDVYNPSPASSNTSVHGRKRIKEKISTKNSKIDNEGSDKTEVLEVQLLEGSLSAIGRSEGRDSRGSVFESLGFDQSSELLSNVSEISLIEQIFGGVPDSESKGGLIRDVENLHNKRTTRNNLPREKNLPKKLAGRTENTEKEEMKKPSRIEKNSAPKSNNAIEDKDKAQKNVVEAPENKKAAVNQQGNSKITFARKTDSSERVKTEEDRLHIRKVKVEKYSTNTQPGSFTLPLKMLDTPQKLEYWTVSHAKNNTPVKEQKMGNKSDPEVQTAPNEAKVRIQKLRRSEQQAAGKQPIPIYPQEQELREQDKYYEQICALNLPEKLFKTISHEENLRFSVSSSDMGKNDTKKKSRLLTEEKAESYYREEKKQANRIEKSPEIKGFYSEQHSYLKSLNSQTKNQVSRSRTEDKTSLIKSRTEDTVTISGLQKSFTDLHKVPAKQAQSKRITSSLKVLTSFNDNQQKSARLETNSREGGSLGHILSNTTHNLKTQSSMEHTRSIRGNLSEERLTGSSSSRAPKTVSVRSLQSTMKSQGKASVPNTYSSKLHTQEISDNSTAVTRRINGQTMAAASLSSKGHLLTNLPISPRKQINLNINLKKLSQESQSKQQDSGIDNSYGFWTSRSSRGNVNESSKKSIKESPKLPSDRGAYTDGRDYGNHPRYGSGSMTEKPSALSSRRLTKVSMYHEFKLRENEMLRSIKNLKPDYMMAMWPPASADKITVENQETKKRLSSSGKRLSTSRAVKGKKRAEGKI